MKPNKIKVAVFGALGKMGQTVCQAVIEDEELVLVGAFDRKSEGQVVANSDNLKVVGALDGLKDSAPDVVVDFTIADAVLDNVEAAVSLGANAVIGTTGLSADQLSRLGELAKRHNRNIILAPNFALGAVIMMKVCQKIASYFDRVEIIEFHHDQKHDAPSGTAILTVEMIADKINPKALDEVEKYPGARGARVQDIPVHSVRLPGLVAHQEVLFGLKGQTLTIRHDSIDRSSFMPGVVLAIKAVGSQPGFTYGLDKIIDV